MARIQDVALIRIGVLGVYSVYSTKAVASPLTEYCRQTPRSGSEEVVRLTEIAKSPKQRKRAE